MFNGGDTLANENNTNNPVINQQAFDQLKAELEAEKAKAPELVNQATQPLKERIAALEADLQTKSEETEGLKAAVAEKDKGFASLTTNFEAAVGAYRNQVLKFNPLIPPEMILGNTIADIDQAVAKATALVGKIKEGLTQEIQQATIPAGAPGRTPPDTSSMTTREKITQGISNARKKSA
jgi:hypothetical protein